MAEYYSQSGGYEGTYDSNYGGGDQAGYEGSGWATTDYSQGYEGSYGGGRGRGRGRGSYGGGGYQQQGGYQQGGYGGGRGGYRGGRGGGGFQQGGSTFRGGRGRGGYQNRGEFRTLDDTVYITGLPESTKNEDLVEKFKDCGEIKTNNKSGESCVFIFLDREQQLPTGAGSVAFLNPESAADAIQRFNGQDFNGSTIKVEYQKKRVKDYGGGYRGSRGGGGGYGGYQGGNGGGYGGYQGYNQGGYGGSRGGYGGYSGYEGSY